MMLRLIALIALVWGLISCQPPSFDSGSSAIPVIPTRTPGVPQPTILIPPPI